MRKQYISTIIVTMLVVLLIGCEPAAPTATPALPTHTPMPPAATATPTLPSAPPTATAVATEPEPTVTPTPIATQPEGAPSPIQTERATPPTATQTELEPAPAPVEIEEISLAATADIRTYGGRQNDAAYDILLLTDGGTLIVGRANNTGPSHRITPGNARLIRTDADGNIIWQKDYAGETDAMFYSPIQVGEDAYVVLGQIAASYERDETDFYLVKIDGKGREIWSHTYGGRGMDHAKMVRQTSDGGFILIGGRADEFPSGCRGQRGLDANLWGQESLPGMGGCSDTRWRVRPHRLGGQDHP